MTKMREKGPLGHIWNSVGQLLKIKPTRCTNFSNLFLEWISTCFGQFLCPSSKVPSSSCSQGVSKTLWHISLLCVQWKSADDGQRNCPKHIEFNSKNEFEKLVHPVGFILNNLLRCTFTWTSNSVGECCRPCDTIYKKSVYQHLLARMCTLPFSVVWHSV